MYQNRIWRILGVESTTSGGMTHEHDDTAHDRSSPVIRIGSVGESMYDVRVEMATSSLPRPRASVDNGSVVRPPAA
jgi:hypothetical protein